MYVNVYFIPQTKEARLSGVLTSLVENYPRRPGFPIKAYTIKRDLREGGVITELALHNKKIPDLKLDEPRYLSTGT